MSSTGARLLACPNPSESSATAHSAAPQPARDVTHVILSHVTHRHTIGYFIGKDISMLPEILLAPLVYLIVYLSVTSPRGSFATYYWVHTPTLTHTQRPAPHMCCHGLSLSRTWSGPAWLVLHVDRLWLSCLHCGTAILGPVGRGRCHLWQRYVCWRNASVEGAATPAINLIAVSLSDLPFVLFVACCGCRSCTRRFHPCAGCHTLASQGINQPATHPPAPRRNSCS